MDIYTSAVAKLVKDDRSLSVLAGLSGVPKETLRDIKSKRITNPRLDTLQGLVKLYPPPKKKRRR